MEDPVQPLPASAFTLVERRQKGGATQWAYRFVGAPKSCLYKVVVLEKAVDKDDWAWNVSGFTSMTAYKANSEADRLNCYLVKVDQFDDRRPVTPRPHTPNRFATCRRRTSGAAPTLAHFTDPPLPSYLVPHDRHRRP